MVVAIVLDGLDPEDSHGYLKKKQIFLDANDCIFRTTIDCLNRGYIFSSVYINLLSKSNKN